MITNYQQRGFLILSALLNIVISIDKVQALLVVQPSSRVLTHRSLVSSSSLPLVVHQEERKTNHYHHYKYSKGSITTHVHNILQLNRPRSFTALLASMENSPAPLEQETSQEPLVRNFRKAAALNNRIYRCANTDPLGTLFQTGEYDSSETKGDGSISMGLKSFETNANANANANVNAPEHIILFTAGLILDLRSDSERKEGLAQAWMTNSPGGQLETIIHSRDDNQREKNVSGNAPTSKNYNAQESKRCVYRIDVLSAKRLFEYMSQNWITDPIPKAQYAFSAIFDTKKLHEMRMDVLNSKGIQGTYEAMLETSGEEFFAALKSITEFFENNVTGDVVVHCVKGKDRTGLVIMLCQAILGVDDATIVKDYHKSESLLGKMEGSAAAYAIASSEQMQVKGKLNKSFFSGSPEIAMISTLAFVREKYGSLHGYLDVIGFDVSCRQRFVTAMDGDIKLEGISVTVNIQSKL